MLPESHPLRRMVDFLRRYEDFTFLNYDVSSSSMRAAIKYRQSLAALQNSIVETPCVTSATWEQAGSLSGTYHLFDKTIASVSTLFL
uniref:Uncharacterized protein n=1 Tax=Psilocybe cubensis TaxID=181762 RepID=A0A8H7XLD2_PSICU